MFKTLGQIEKTEGSNIVIDNLLPESEAYDFQTTVIEYGEKKIRGYSLLMSNPASVKDFVELTRIFNTNVEQSDHDIGFMLYGHSRPASVVNLILGTLHDENCLKFLSNLGKRNIMLFINSQVEVTFVNLFQYLAKTLRMTDTIIPTRIIDWNLTLNKLLDEVVKEK